MLVLMMLLHPLLFYFFIASCVIIYMVDMLSVETDHIVLGGVVMGLEGLDGR